MKKFDEYPILAVTSDDESYPFGMRKMSNNSVIYYKLVYIIILHHAFMHETFFIVVKRKGDCRSVSG